LIVAYRNGLRDVARPRRVIDSVANNRLASRYNGQQVVTLTVAGSGSETSQQIATPSHLCDVFAGLPLNGQGNTC